VTDNLADDPSNRPPARAAGWTAFLGRLTWRSVVVALTLGALAAVATNPMFAVTPFAVVLGRCLFLSMVLLLAFAAAGHWRQRWLPRWLMQALAWWWAWCWRWVRWCANSRRTRARGNCTSNSNATGSSARRSTRA
jgi:Zn-dependent protease with chaperone function